MKIVIVLYLMLLLIFVGCEPNVRFSDNIVKNDKKIAECSSNSDKALAEKIDVSLYDKPAKLIYPKSPINTHSYKIVSIAQKWLGVKYVYGGNTREGVDCSGFVKNVYSEVGINLPRTSGQMYQFAIPIQSPAVGDLVFFKKGGKINHVAIYLGEDRIIHSALKKGVIEQRMSGTHLEKTLCGYGKVC